MAENLLVLAPSSSTDSPSDPESLIAMLQQEQFLGEAITVNGAQHYRPGEEFMMLITFLGCSPMIATGEMESSGEQYCHIAVEGPFDAPRYLVGDNIKVPRCPKCGHRFDDWRELLETWQGDPEAKISCPDCAEEISPPHLRWRKSAGFGRFFIKVWGIFESEAVPSPNLLALLKKTTGLEWQHFYLRLR